MNMCNDMHHEHKVFAGCFPFGAKDIAKMKNMAGHFMKSFAGCMGSWIHHNIEDLGKNYLITVPLPGRAKEDVQVSLINKTLNIKAKKPKIAEKGPEEEKPKKEAQYHGFPFFWKGFMFVDVDMDVPLPADADENSIISKMANGLLKITIGKKPAKNIDINEN